MNATTKQRAFRIFNGVVAAALLTAGSLFSTAAMAGKPTGGNTGAESIPFSMHYKCSGVDYFPYVYFSLESQSIPSGMQFRIDYVTGWLQQGNSSLYIGQVGILFSDITTSGQSTDFNVVSTSPGPRIHERIVNSSVSLVTETQPDVKALGFTSTPGDHTFCSVVLHGSLESL